MSQPCAEDAEVFSVRPAGEYTQLTVIAPRIAEQFRAGQFVSAAVGGADSALILRRPVAVGGASPSASYAGTIDVVIDPTDAGGQWLAQRRVGDRLPLLGPLGRPFSLPGAPSPAVLVGVGAQTACLLPLARALVDAGSPIEFVLAAPSTGRLYGEQQAKRLAGRVTVAVDDGASQLVAEALPAAIGRLGAQAVYAAGPVPLLRAIGEIAARHSVPAEVVPDVPMPCGTGLCHGCAVPVRGGVARACVDGPAFDAATIRWSAVPRDLVGASGRG